MEVLFSRKFLKREIIRAILRGKDIKRYGYEWADKYLIATFPSRHYDIELYPAVKQHLLSFGKKRLEQTGETYEVDGKKLKSRKKTNNKWFETQDSISYWEDFNKPKIVWPRLMRISKEDGLSTFPRFSMVNEQFLVVDSLCFFVGEHIENLAIFLNSQLAIYFYFKNIAILDNGGMQMRQQYIEKIPCPPHIEAIHDDSDIYQAFGLSQEEIYFINSFIKTKLEDIQKSSR